VLIWMQLSSLLRGLGPALGPCGGLLTATSAYDLVGPAPSNEVSFVLRVCTSSCSSIFWLFRCY
jgi:hypothetical protein